MLGLTRMARMGTLRADSTESAAGESEKAVPEAGRAPEPRRFLSHLSNRILKVFTVILKLCIQSMCGHTMA